LQQHATYHNQYASRTAAHMQYMDAVQHAAQNACSLGYKLQRVQPPVGGTIASCGSTCSRQGGPMQESAIPPNTAVAEQGSAA
jgi:hypothetical protein